MLSPIAPFLLLLIVCVEKVVAPFPPSHTFHFLNPVIDPWWYKLDEESQKEVYSWWEAKEPYLEALAEAIHLKKKLRILGWRNYEETILLETRKGFVKHVDDETMTRVRVERETKEGLEEDFDDKIEYISAPPPQYVSPPPHVLNLEVSLKDKPHQNLAQPLLVEMWEDKDEYSTRDWRGVTRNSPRGLATDLKQTSGQSG